MQAGKAIGDYLRLMGKLAPTDLRNISREALLIFLILLPLPIALVLRFLIPELETTLQTRLEFDLAPYHPLIMAGFITMPAGLIGSLYGLMLVDERDEGTLAVLRVMPVSFDAYLFARLAIPTSLAALMIILTYPLAGLTPIPLGAVIAIALTGATAVPMAALVVVAIAPNKVAALAVFRLLNTILTLPAFIFIAPAWQAAGWLVPSYWPMKALWLAAEGQGFALELLIGLAVNAIWTVAFYRLFARQSER